MSNDDPQQRRSGSVIAVFLGVAAVLGACLASFDAFATDAILSTDESYSHQTPLLIAQLVVAIVGLIPAGLFARALYRKDGRAGVWLAIGIVTYLSYGVLNDAAVHGWANLQVF